MPTLLSTSQWCPNSCHIFVKDILCRFGSCAEVVTDVGTEFAGESAELLGQHYIDHCTTSPNRPEMAKQCMLEGLHYLPLRM